MLTVYGRFSKDGYIIYDTKLKKFSYLKSSTSPSYTSYYTLVLRDKLISNKYKLINKNDFVLEFFDEETFTLSHCLVLGIDDFMLTKLGQNSNIGIFDTNGDFITREILSNINIDFVCVAPQVECLGTNSINYDSIQELWLPIGLKHLYCYCIKCARLTTLHIESFNLSVNINALLQFNPRLNKIVIPKDFAVQKIRGNRDVVCIEKVE